MFVYINLRITQNRYWEILDNMNKFSLEDAVLLWLKNICRRHGIVPVSVRILQIKAEELAIELGYACSNG